MATASEPGAEDHSTTPSAGASTADFVTALDVAVECDCPVDLAERTCRRTSVMTGVRDLTGD